MWNKVKEIVERKIETFEDYSEQFSELYKLGVFNNKHWWEIYESEMYARGMSWEESWRNFPLLAKFLLDISKGQNESESYEITPEIKILFKDVKMPKGQFKFLQCIFEMCGLALEPQKKFQKMYSLVGRGGDGKSVLLGLFDAVMNNTINGNLCGHTPIEQLGDKFALQSLVGQVCNICDDTNDKVISNTGIIKTLIGAGGSGSGITVPRKNREDFWWDNPEILLIIAGNNLPKFRDDSDGMMRRVIYLIFKNSMKIRGEVDIRLGDKLRLNRMNLDILFGIGRCAISDAMKRGKLCEMSESDAIKERMIEKSKSDVDKWIEEIEMKQLLKEQKAGRERRKRECCRSRERRKLA